MVVQDGQGVDSRSRTSGHLRRRGVAALGAVAIGAATLLAVPSTAVASSAALVDCGGSLQALAPNDDGSTGAVDVGFPVNLFGSTYTSLFVNNNGNVTFNAPLGDFTPYQLTADTPPIIAPFFADVDTQGGNVPTGDTSTVDIGAGRSGLVEYGTTSYLGRQAFCVNWFDVNGGVGYFSQHIDKRNTFQLLIVDRSSGGAVGDVDLLFNYAGIQWETGDASGGVDGLGGSAAGAGYSAGDGNPNHFFEVAGSREPGAFLDGGTNPLTSRTINSTVPGRFIFSVRNGGSTGTGGISGTVTGSDGLPLEGSTVQVCPSAGGRCVFTTRTRTGGAFDTTGLAPGNYDITAYAPQGTNYTTDGFVDVPVGDTIATVDIVLSLPAPPPPGTTITSPRAGDDGIPVVYYRDPLTLRTTACVGGTGTFEIRLTTGELLRSGSLVEQPAGSGAYSAAVAALAPATGYAHVSMRITCGETTDVRDFSIYIDPSGFVRNQNGAPIAGASVVLFRADDSAGPFVQVPNGSALMSPTNRTNPDTSAPDGHFGWDVVAGYYRVSATASGCYVPGQPDQPEVTTPVLEIPPPVTDLDITLFCPSSAPPGGGGAGAGGGGTGGSAASASPSSTPSGQTSAPSPSASASASGAPGTPSPTGAASTCGTAPSVQLPIATIIATGEAEAVLRGVAGTAVELLAYTRPSTTYSVVRRGVLDTTGTSTFRVRPPANTRLVARQVGCAYGDSVVLNVRTALSMAVARSGIRTYRFSGSAAPARVGGLLVSLYRVTASGQQVLTSQTRAVATTGTWQIDRRFTGAGRFGFVVRTGQDLQNAPGASNVRSLLVF